MKLVWPHFFSLILIYFTENSLHLLDTGFHINTVGHTHCKRLALLRGHPGAAKLASLLSVSLSVGSSPRWVLPTRVRSTVLLQSLLWPWCIPAQRQRLWPKDSVSCCFPQSPNTPKMLWFTFSEIITSYSVTSNLFFSQGHQIADNITVKTTLLLPAASVVWITSALGRAYWLQLSWMVLVVDSYSVESLLILRLVSNCLAGRTI